MGLIYKIKIDQRVIENGQDVPFDPASISKLFYAAYIFKNANKSKSVRVENWHIDKYGYGTVAIGKSEVGQRFGVPQLLDMMIRDSCNISTGILADLVVRQSVNEYIKSELKLSNTTVKSEKTENISTAGDLAQFAELIPLELIDLMRGSRRRSEIGKFVGGKSVFKGGITKRGEHREFALLLDDHVKYPRGYIIIAQQADFRFPGSRGIDREIKRVMFRKGLRKLNLEQKR